MGYAMGGEEVRKLAFEMRATVGDYILREPCPRGPTFRKCFHALSRTGITAPGFHYHDLLKTGSYVNHVDCCIPVSLRVFNLKAVETNSIV